MENRIRGSVRGYSGFFDFVRVDERLLDRVYEHDMALMKEVEMLCEAMDALTPESESGLSEVMDLVQQIERKYDQRGEMLEGISSAGP